MRLLVSVTNKREAIAALEGGADFIDAKDPSVGALGAVSIDALQQIVEAVGASRPVTAALGDAISEEWLEYTAERVAATGVSLVKVGFARLGAGRAVSVTRAAIRGVWAGSHGRCGLVAVAYADASRAGSPSPATIVDFAARVGAAGVLVDTFDKDGSGLCDLLPFHELVDLAEAAHDG